MNKVLYSLLLISCFSLAQESSNELTELDWKTTPQSYAIAKDVASITTTENEYLVLDKDAKRFWSIVHGYESNPDAVVFRVSGDEQDSHVIYTINDIGFLKKDDWQDTIDEGSMLKEIKANTAEANKVRAEGYPKVFVDGWAEQPHLDAKNNIVYWAISGHDSNNDKFINAKALKLGRKGYTEILWIGDPSQFKGAENTLNPVLSGYDYQEGFQYKDFVPETDTVAAAGVGALVYKLATGKAAKLGIGALMALFAKKFWFLLIIPFVWGWKKIKEKLSKDGNN